LPVRHDSVGLDPSTSSGQHAGRTTKSECHHGGPVQCRTNHGGGKDLPQQHQIEMFVMDQYWRMIAHVDVLGSLRWGEVFCYTPEERTALDKEIAHIREFKGYGYWEVGTTLETLADKTVALACRERPSNSKRCTKD
jgi:hypothetical protein